MNQERKIPLYAKRSFSDKVSAVFEFLLQNRKPLLKWNLYFLLPLSILQSLGVTSLLEKFTSILIGATSANSIVDTSWEDLSIALLAYGTGFILFMALFFSLYSLYLERPLGLADVKWADISPYFKRNIGRSVIMSFLTILLIGGLSLVLGGVVALLNHSGVILLILEFFLLALALFVPLVLLPPIYFIEKIGFFSAVGKAFRLGFTTWGGTFLIVFVVGLLANMLQSMLSLPFSLLSIIRSVFLENGGEGTLGSSVMLFLSYTFGVISAFGSYVAMFLTMLATTYQYGHAVEVTDTVTLDDDIDSFEQK